MQDLVSEISVAQTLAPALRAASGDGAGVDLQGFDAAVVVVECGVITDGTHTIEVQESDDNVAFTAVATADLSGAEPAVVAADDNDIFEIGYFGTKRFIRAIVTVTGAPATGGVYGAHVVRGRARKQPK